MLTFAQPLFLLALGALVVPVIIHRISRARPVPWKFPSISRIRQTPLPRHGSRSLTDLLLLLLRLILLACLIIALAGPLWQPDEADSIAGADIRKSTVILLDYSSSMSGWDAVEETENVLETIFTSLTGDAAWVAFSTNVVTEQALGESPVAIRSLEDFIRNNQPGPTAGNPESGLRRALEILQGREAGKIILISDFQSTDWGGALPQVPEAIDIELFQVGKSDRGLNNSIHQVGTLPGSGDRIRVLAEAVNFSNRDQQAVFTLSFGETTLNQEQLLKPGIRNLCVFEVDEPDYREDALIRISSPSDPYPRDDEWNLSLSAPLPLDVLALNPPGNPSQGDEEIFFIDQALQTASTREWIQFSVLPTGPAAINPETLTRIAAVVIPSGTAGTPTVPWDTLKEYAMNGGLVLVTLGEDAVRAIAAIKAGGVDIGDYKGLAGRERFKRHYAGPIPESSRLASVFDGPAERDLYLMTLYQYSRLAPPPGGNILLQSEEGHPLLMDIPVGNGHFVLSTFPWDRRGGDFPLRPSFLPVVREIMGMSLGKNRELLSKNPDPPAPRSESVTTTSPQESVTAKLRGGRIMAEGDAVGPAKNPVRKAGVDLAPWMLLAAFVFWLFESFLAAWLIRSPKSKGRNA